MLGNVVNNTSTNLLNYKDFTHIKDLPKDHWIAIQKNQSIFLSLQYLSALESTLSEHIFFRYIIFYEKTVPIGIAVTQLIKVHTSDLDFEDFPCKINETIKNLILENLDINVLVCGNLFSCGEHGFLFDQRISKSKAISILSDTLLELRKKNSTNKTSFILIKEFWPDSSDETEAFARYKFRKFSIDHNMVLNILPGWNTFDDYLNSLKTKFRSRAKKVFSNSRTIIIRNLNIDDIVKYEDDIHTLYISVLNNANFKIGKLNVKTFIKLKEMLGDSFIFKGYFIKDELVGFSTAFETETAIEANHIGINYQLNKMYDIYQRMLYDYIQTAIDKEAKELHLGRTAETIKSAVGAKPVAMQLFVRHSNSISNKILKPLMEMIVPSEFEGRNPFKNDVR